uniref:BLTX516 n=1 Tax=Nephila pilipes TaxID=299642 RepID=A0A076KZT1_NEPPI|nr:BLTX516 [Nephila pilipes]
MFCNLCYIFMETF